MSTDYVITPPATVGLPVAGTSALFPVRRVYCVGRNYSAHAREMGFDPDREPPFFFCKPNDAESVVPVAAGQTVPIPYPSLTGNYHYEIELVVAIGEGGSDIPVAEAAGHVYGYAVGLDMTRRDLQIQMREMGRPWEIGKAFDFSAPVGVVHPAPGQALERGAIWLDVDGQRRQSSDLANLIWSVAETIAQLSTLFRLEPGDLVFSGTPEGVGAVTRGQLLRGGIDGLGELSVLIA
jgi:fumarylpyruvate hydrolase